MGCYNWHTQLRCDIHTGDAVVTQYNLFYSNIINSENNKLHESTMHKKNSWISFMESNC